MSKLAKRRKQELLNKLRSVPEEFEYWLAQSKEGQPLEKHNTQIRKLTSVLQELVESVRKELTALSEDAAALKKVRELEEVVLDLHRIWDFFRQKLLQRGFDQFAATLAAYDDLVWACYEPALEAHKKVNAQWEEKRQPPLVYLDSDGSPYMLPRDAPYSGQGFRKLRRESFRKIVRELPIPVVGAPWFHLEHLPDALILTHEVGHVVEDDFGLTGDLKANLDRELDDDEARLRDAGADDEAIAAFTARRPAWQAWMGELFADAYGVVAAGPAFVGSLIDFLSRDPERIASEKRPRWGKWEDYPTDALRVLTNLAMLENTGFPTAVAELRAAWTAAYPEHTLTHYEADAPAVARALLDGQLAGLNEKSIKAVLPPWPASRQAALETHARDVALGLSLQTKDVRELFALARLTFEKNPAAWREKGIQDKITSRLASVRKDGPRSAGDEEHAAGQDPAAHAENERERAAKTATRVYEFLAVREEEAVER